MTLSPFHGERVYLRAFEPDDAPNLQRDLNRPELIGRRCIPWRFPAELPLSLKQAQAIIERWAEGENQFHLAVVLARDEKQIGHVNGEWGWDAHCPEIEIRIAPDYQRQGYGSEVMQLLLDYFFERTPAYNLGSGMADWNQAARKFAQKFGFTETGKMRRAGLRDGAYFDWIGVDILRPEWLAQKGAA
ncbi:MAG: GNAT family N-acetyltransferase [Chloroflexi bacterium]|nr:GNAT family N-acetyltransferase [Chloroflexota bacterium]